MFPSRNTRRSAAVALGLALLLTGCVGPPPPPDQGGNQESPTPPVQSGPNSGTGEGSNGGSSDGERSNGGDSDGEREGETEVVYEWTLPASDTSPSGSEGPAYGELQKSCQAGQDFLDRKAKEVNYGFFSPRNVVLFGAGIRACFGDVAGARLYFDHALSFYGLQGMGIPSCDLYKSLASVLAQRPRDDYACPSGEYPLPKLGENGVWDDPLTLNVDESMTLQTETSTPLPLPSEESSEAPSDAHTEPPTETVTPSPDEPSE